MAPQIGSNSDESSTTITTTKVTSRLNIKWTFEDYLKWADTIPKNGHALSHPFKLIEKGNGTIHEFVIRIYPNRDTDDESEGYLSTYMYYMGPKKALKCDFKVDIKKSNGELHPVVPKEIHDLDGDGWGLRKSLLVSTLKKEKDLFLQSGSLVFVGHVQLTSENEYSTNVKDSKFLLKENLETKAPQMALLGKYFKDTNNEKEYEGDFSDFKIICDDRKEKRSFDVHRVIIAAGSPVFRAMLTNDCKESNERSVTVSDISPDIMEKLLHFIYTDIVEAGNVNTELLSAANKYGMDKLQGICELELIDELDESIAIHLAVISDLYGSELFKDEIAKFIAKNWLKIKQKADFDVMEKHPSLMSRIMKLLSY